MIVHTKLFTQRAAYALAALGLLAAAPAQATTATATTTAAAPQAAQAPVDESEPPLAKGDEKFQELFAEWEKLDRDKPGVAPVKVAVSIPSRMPLDGAQLTSSYGMRNHPILRKRARHTGVDLAAPTGTPIYATADGYVQMAEWFSSYGKFIKISHGSELETRYAHLSRIAVSEGDMVKKGDLIGYVGSTGRSTGPHLHYEVRIAGEAVNPIPYMVESEAQIAFAKETGRNLAVGGD